MRGFDDQLRRVEVDLAGTQREGFPDPYRMDPCSPGGSSFRSRYSGAPSPSCGSACHVDNPLGPDQARDLLRREAPGVQVADRREDGVYVSRLRRDPTVPHGLAFWCVSDNRGAGRARADPGQAGGLTSPAAFRGRGYGRRAARSPESRRGRRCPAPSAGPTAGRWCRHPTASAYPPTPARCAAAGRRVAPWAAALPAVASVGAGPVGWQATKPTQASARTTAGFMAEGCTMNLPWLQRAQHADCARPCQAV